METTILDLKWQQHQIAGAIELSHPAVGRLSNGSSLVDGAARLDVRIECEPNRVTLYPILTNESAAAVEIGDVVLMDWNADFKIAFSHAFVNGRTMVDNTGLVCLDQNVLSNSVIGLTAPNGSAAFVAGSIRPDDAWYDFTISADLLGVQVICRLENTVLAPGASRTLSPIRLYSGRSMSRLLASYAEDTAEQMVPIFNFNEPPSGWCSWYYYYSTDCSDDIRSNMQAIRSTEMGNRPQVIQIDEGWNRAAGEPRNWGDWTPGGKFPEGMKTLVDEIHDSGFQAGLWLAPFSVDEASTLYKEHPEWLVQATGVSGELDPQAAPGGVFGLDLTHPDVQQFLRVTFRRVFQEWRFDYIKIDFLAHGSLEGRRFDRSKTGIEAFRIGMQIIRDEAGPNRFILNCGSPIAASIGLCDGMRIGMDVGGRWFAPMNLKEWRYGNCCLKAAANSTIWRQWMHRAWWYNDPDCVILRNEVTPVEWNTFKGNPLEDEPVEEAHFELTSKETIGWLRLIWMSGGMLIVSEDMGQLTPQSWKDLVHAWPLNTDRVRLIDSYGIADVYALVSDSEPRTIGLFNLSDQEASLSFSADELGGLPASGWSFVEKWSGERFSGTGDEVAFPALPAHAGRIWILNG